MKIKMTEGVFDTKIIFYEDNDRCRTVYNFYTGEGKTFKMGEVLPESELDAYTLKIPNMLAGEFIEAIKELAEQNGIKPQSEARLEGTLAATKAHLEDMRALVFKGKK